MVLEIHPAIGSLTRSPRNASAELWSTCPKAREWEGAVQRKSNRMISERLRREDNEKLLVLVFCRAGRHRSVATGHVLCHNLQADGSIVSLEHMSQGSFWRTHVWWRVQVLQPRRQLGPSTVLVRSGNAAISGTMGFFSLHLKSSSEATRS